MEIVGAISTQRDAPCHRSYTIYGAFPHTLVWAPLISLELISNDGTGGGLSHTLWVIDIWHIDDPKPIARILSKHAQQCINKLLRTHCCECYLIFKRTFISTETQLVLCF